jgi:hypothetical protein
LSVAGEEKIRVLIVDDDPNFVEAATALLQPISAWRLWAEPGTAKKQLRRRLRCVPRSWRWTW